MSQVSANAVGKRKGVDMRSKIAAFLQQAFLVLSWPASAFAQQQPAPWNWPGPWHMWAGWGMWWIFPLIMLLFVAGCIAMILHIRSSGGPGRHHPDFSGGDPTRSALQILNERFARGEIRREEYEERKRAILTLTGPTGNL
jgi:putative membrane protein